MMEFVNNLISHGFTETGTIAERVRAFYIISDETAYVLCMVDDKWLYKYYGSMDAHADKADPDRRYEVLEVRVKSLFNQKYYRDVRLHMIVVTDNTDFFRRTAVMNTSFWILDDRTGRLIVYENQPDDFAGARRLIEGYIPEKDDTHHMQSRRFSGSIYHPDRVLTASNVFVILNLLVYLYTASQGDVLDADYLLKCGGLIAPLTSETLYTLLSYSFIHAGFSHLIGNMLSLYFLGNIVERYIGMLRYIALYVAGIFGSAAMILIDCSINENYHTVYVGASGAIYGLLGAFVVMVITDKRIRKMFTLNDIIFYLIITVSVATTMKNVAHWGHIGGFITGVTFMTIYTIYVKKLKTDK